MAMSQGSAQRCIENFGSDQYLTNESIFGYNIHTEVYMELIKVLDLFAILTLVMLSIVIVVITIRFVILVIRTIKENNVR